MHPIERLRYVARAGDADPSLLAEEAALALGALAREPRALVPAARRLLEFHPACSPMWWVCAELLAAADPEARAEELADELRFDPTPDELAAALPGAVTLATTAGPAIASALLERPDLTVRLFCRAGEMRRQLHRLGEAVEVSGYLEHELAEAVEGASVVLVEAEALAAEGALLGPLASMLARGAGDAERWDATARGRLLPGALLGALREAAERPGRPPGRRGQGARGRGAVRRGGRG